VRRDTNTPLRLVLMNVKALNMHSWLNLFKIKIIRTTCVSVRYEMQLNEDIWLIKSSVLKIMNQLLSQTFKKQEGA